MKSSHIFITIFLFFIPATSLVAYVPQGTANTQPLSPSVAFPCSQQYQNMILICQEQGYYSDSCDAARNDNTQCVNAIFSNRNPVNSYPCATQYTNMLATCQENGDESAACAEAKNDNVDCLNANLVAPDSLHPCYDQYRNMLSSCQANGNFSQACSDARGDYTYCSAPYLKRNY